MRGRSTGAPCGVAAGKSSTRSISAPTTLSGSGSSVCGSSISPSAVAPTGGASTTRFTTSPRPRMTRPRPSFTMLAPDVVGQRRERQRERAELVGHHAAPEHGERLRHRGLDADAHRGAPCGCSTWPRTLVGSARTSGARSIAARTWRSIAASPTWKCVMSATLVVSSAVLSAGVSSRSTAAAGWTMSILGRKRTGQRARPLADDDVVLGGGLGAFSHGGPLGRVQAAQGPPTSRRARVFRRILGEVKTAGGTIRGRARAHPVRGQGRAHLVRSHGSSTDLFSARHRGHGPDGGRSW